MDVTITFGAWLLPFSLSVGAFVTAFMLADHGPATGYGSIGKGFVNLFLYGVALIFSLALWLAWALVV